jgi:hypothetical protein
MLPLIAMAVLDAGECQIPSALSDLWERGAKYALPSYNNDLQRNRKVLQNLCIYPLGFREGKYHWRMLLVFNPKKSHDGPFWFLPHDNEQSAFDAALYSVRHYGGGFLSVVAEGQRYMQGQDPNRNFGTTISEAHVCRGQHAPAPQFSQNVFHIIDSFKPSSLPYLALHTNANGWSGNGGKGTISILKKSRKTRSFSASEVHTGRKVGLSDEDSLIYMAGRTSRPPYRKISWFNNAGIHVKYEIVTPTNNDCSMSNYVILRKGAEYYNIETEEGDLKTQRRMIDILMNYLGLGRGATMEGLF